MLISIVAIGNSKGIRLPKAILEQCQIEDSVELEVVDKNIILKPVSRKPREGWGEQFKLMAERGDDVSLIDDSLDLDVKSWEW